MQSHGASRREETNKRSTTRKQRNPGTKGDTDDIQTAPPPELDLGTLDYETIAVDADSLLAVTDRWMTKYEKPICDTRDPIQGPTPVLWVALHACGSLTLDILRAFARRIRQEDQKTTRTWVPTSAVIVGCCYNMLRPEGKSALFSKEACCSFSPIHSLQIGF